MKRFLKNFYVYFLFILLQTMFLFLDYFYINKNEPFSVHVNLFTITFMVTMLTLSIRTIFEAFCLAAATKILKKPMSLRDIVKTLFHSMRLSVVSALVFLLIQIIFIRNTAEIYQIVAIVCINFMYMILVCANLKKHDNNVAFNTFAVYSFAYLIMQGYSVYSLI